MNVFFIDTVHHILWDTLLKRGFNCSDHTLNSLEKILTYSDDCEGIVIRSRFKLNKDTLDQFPNLKFIARSGAGLENIDLEHCKKRKISVYNSPEGNRTAVAEHAIGMILSLFNHLKRGDSEVKSAQWNRERNRGLELEGKTVAIIGYGQMGSAFAQRLRGFDCKTIAYDKYKSDFSNEYVEEIQMDTVFQESDIVSLHIPISDETQYLVNKEFLESFKKPIFLINTARGNHVKISDLLESLDSNKVLGACLDVLEYEKFNFEVINEKELPLEWSNLTQRQNVLLSPHVAGWTEESYEKLSSVLAEKILRDWK